MMDNWTPTAVREPTQGLAGLLSNYSLEMTAKDIEKVEAAADMIPPGTLISVTFLPNEDFDARIKASVVLKQLGLVPVPHISARRLKTEAELEGFLDRLQSEVGMERAFVVAGDATPPEGPYDDALAVIRSGLLWKYGIRHLGIAGYPEGHPDISDDKLWQALRDKMAAAKEQGIDFTIVTQFGFDADPVLDWLARVRREGVEGRIRVGVSGPASVKTLVRYAARCGVGTSAKVMKKYGMSLMSLLSTAGPDPIIHALAEGLDPAVHGEVKLQFYPFGGFGKTAEWIRDFRIQQGL